MCLESDYWIEADCRTCINEIWSSASVALGQENFYLEQQTPLVTSTCFKQFFTVFQLKVSPKISTITIACVLVAQETISILESFTVVKKAFVHF